MQKDYISTYANFDSIGNNNVGCYTIFWKGVYRMKITSEWL